MTYSVAIRTLALAPESLRRTLEGVWRQSVSPRRVAVYIAEGYDIPDFRVGAEEYVVVPKGMMRQRIRDYGDMDSDCILMLDDDVLLLPGTAERLLGQMERLTLDAVGADVFENHRLSAGQKVKAALLNMTFPHHGHDRGFVLRPWGSFAYPASPAPEAVSTHTLPGPLMMWRRSSFERLDAGSELWLEELGYPYGEDALLTYKGAARGMKMAVDFGAAVENLEARTASDVYRKGKTRFRQRARAMAMTWWRMLYKPHGNALPGSKKALVGGMLKYVWVSAAMAAVSLATLSAAPLVQWLGGVREGLCLARGEAFASLPPYVPVCEPENRKP